MPATRLELVWPNKDKFLLVPKDETGKPVWVERDHPAASEVRISDFTASYGDVDEVNPYADNLLFTGDSLDVMRILNEVPEFRREYRGKVKLAYWDPPFNTEQTFNHYDDWMEHSVWLSFMRERVTLVKDLLAPDGSIWMHLDDAEVHRMRCLMDEVFGSSCYVGTVVWRSSDNSNNDAKKVSRDHNEILVYAKNPNWTSNRLEASLDDLPHFKNPDGDVRGPWFDGNPLNSPSPRTELMYDVVGPHGDVIKYPPNGWRWSRETMEARMATGEIRFTEDGKGIRRRTYFEDHAGLPPSSLWVDVTKTGASRAAKSELKRLFPNTPTTDLFDTPKPERFMERVFLSASNEGDVVLDVFGGSGSSAAVAQKMGRRWITSELSESTVEQFILPRLVAVLSGESGGISERVVEHPVVRNRPEGLPVSDFSTAAKTLKACIDSGEVEETSEVLAALKVLRRLGRVTKERVQKWTGGGGFRTVSVGASMYEVTAHGTLLADWATNGRFARAVAGQLGFEWQSKEQSPFCGVRGRMRFAVLDGAVGEEEVRHIVSMLPENERVTIVAKAVLPGAEEVLVELSRGSKILKAPRDVLAPARSRRKRKESSK